MNDFINNPVPTIQEEIITLRIENEKFSKGVSIMPDKELNYQWEKEKEEYIASLRKELDSYKALDSHYDEIEEDAKRIAEENEQLKAIHESDKKSISLIIEKGEELEKENAELKKEISVLLSCSNCLDNKGGYICDKGYNKELKAQIEKMKNCSNCKNRYFETKEDYILCAKCSKLDETKGNIILTKWEFAE